MRRGEKKGGEGIRLKQKGWDRREREGGVKEGEERTECKSVAREDQENFIERSKGRWVKGLGESYKI